MSSFRSVTKHARNPVCDPGLYTPSPEGNINAAIVEAMVMQFPLLQDYLDYYYGYDQVHILLPVSSISAEPE
jgi:hypothetical protein